MSKMVVVGTGRLTQALTAAGFEPARCQTADQMVEALARLARDESVALVVCGESQAADATDAIARFREESDAMLVVLPDTPTPRRVGYELVRTTLERAAGADLLGRVAEEQNET